MGTPMTDKRRRPSQTALTECQRAFVREYLTGVNATVAARRAGYSPGSAGRIAYALLRHPQVAALIEQGNERRAEKRRITADRVMEELGRMAFANIRDYVDWNSEGVKLRDKALLDPEETAAIADIEPKGANGQFTRLKLYDKLAALNALARHLGMIGGKTALGPVDESEERKAANAELRERLMRIVRSGDKK
jgi:phage terminase small subunit